ncbi:hypothetical protein SB658_25830, partial [Bacillus sp. SIMBA_008]|uniref:hypothetical protein n=1 Tax=Bacillus sp. SIMBA_008 TaxID=3085757 RepID=UPI0039795C1D
MTRTLQTRRYRLRPDAAEDFVSWWSSTLVELRENAGFQVEFASYSPDTYEFLWGVSAPGDEDDFLALEAKYVKSP